MNEINEISNSEPLHIGQNKINRALFDYLNEKYILKDDVHKLVQFNFNSEFCKMEKLKENLENTVNQSTMGIKESFFYEV